MNRWIAFRKSLEEQFFDGFDVSQHKLAIIWSWAQNVGMSAIESGANRDDAEAATKVAYEELSRLVKPD